MAVKHAEFNVSRIVGKQRPRIGGRRAYTPSSTRVFEQEVALKYKAQCGASWSTYKGAVSMKIEYTRALPKGKWLKHGDRQEVDTFAPDVDNVFKAVADALNGIAYVDDRQIVDAQVVKHPRHQIEQDKISITIEYL